jgi:hypothetical protein
MGVFFMNKILDKLGICVSGLCLIHCLITPFILVLFPSFKLAFFGHEAFHQIFGVIVVSSVLMAVYPQCRKHGHKDIIGWAIAGVVFIMGGIFLGHDLGEGIEHGLTITGSVLLIVAHIKNIKVRHGKCESTSTCKDGKSHA